MKGINVMSTSTLGALLASALVCCLGPQASTRPSANAQQEARTAARYVLQCEVWSATDPDLVRRIEAQEPTAAEAVLQDLRAAERGAQRLSRALSPVDVGSTVQFESQREFATVTVTQSAGGTTQTGFGGYSSAGTSLVLGCAPGAESGTLRTSLSLSISGVAEGKAAPAQGAPPDRHSIQVRCEGTSTSGELGMYQFQTGEPATLLVFLRATAF